MIDEADDVQRTEVDESASTDQLEKDRQSSPILEPEEIEALMASMEPMEQAEALFASLPPLKQPENIESYNFESGEVDGPARYPLFVNLQERMAEFLKDQWSDTFNRDIGVAFDHMLEEGYRDIITDEKTRVFFAYTVEGYGPMMLAFDVPLIIAHVDAMLGGDGEACGEIPKALSPVERRLSQRIAKSLEKHLETAWEPVTILDFELFKIDTDPQFLSVAGATENCFSMYFNIQLDEKTTGSFALHYPRTFLEPMLDNLRSTVSDDAVVVDEEWKAAMEKSLSVVPMPIILRLGECSLTIEDFLRLSEGDYLPFQVNEGEPATLWVNNTVMFQAQAGSQDGVLAAEILNKVA
ncbi:MAG: FliM/FliN family flagellar motor switch protein [Mariprofundaceae bacterium]|nr:FliM/FliN family flagellar motor switch protein [Mariprofundaceae bacterium]